MNELAFPADGNIGTALRDLLTRVEVMHGHDPADPRHGSYKAILEPLFRHTRLSVRFFAQDQAR